jgi:uracil DNA glycosylase
MFFEAMHPTWQNWLDQQKPLLDALEHRVLAENQVTPDLNQVMRAFELDPANIKVVILGQDPYPTEGDAVGLAFAMNSDSKMPRSLVNIAKELTDDLGVEVKTQADLSKWSSQVLTPNLVGRNSRVKPSFNLLSETRWCLSSGVHPQFHLAGKWQKQLWTLG